MPKYHHGNLRNALLSIAAELLAEDGLHALSLRKMAQRAGVSHNAPYMHFADKEAVLVAIAEEGFRLLSVEVESAISQSSTTRLQLISASNAYVNFALNYPNHVQLMFCAYDEEKYPSLLESSQASLHRLFELVKTGQEKRELISGNTQEMTKAIWAMVHGVATLSIAYKTNSLLPGKISTAETISVFIDCLLDGLAA
ncbi:TetR/AcrR family transcriptional regulator [Chamaesiphon sp.]|uniref:TetR/AcrR family transcriptional regulator n=1 Tax=Chamaesiphon sp. TaxID=2814140 RepID=UPI0035939303